MNLESISRLCRYKFGSTGWIAVDEDLSRPVGSNLNARGRRAGKRKQAISKKTINRGYVATLFWRATSTKQYEVRYC